jgi:hypothetical protein
MLDNIVIEPIKSYYALLKWPYIYDDDFVLLLFPNEKAERQNLPNGALLTQIW